MNYEFKIIMRNIVTILCFITVIGTAQAQHEFSINAFGGLQPVNLTLSKGGTNSGSFGGGAGVGYNYYFNNNWSIGTGAGLSFYATSIAFDSLDIIHEGYDQYEGTDFIFTAELDKFKEDVSVLLLEIPLTARYSLPFGENSLRLAGGVKFGLPLSHKYTVSADNLKTTGQYVYENWRYENIPGVFVDEKLAEYSDSWEANMAILLTLELSYRFAVGKKNGLAAGIYFNYGLNDMQGKNERQPVAFDIYRNKPYTNNSILNSGFASSIKPMAFGLKLSFDFGR